MSVDRSKSEMVSVYYDETKQALSTDYSAIQNLAITPGDYMNIGGRGTSEYFPGEIGIVMVLDTLLTDDEIKDIYRTLIKKYI